MNEKQKKITVFVSIGIFILIVLIFNTYKKNELDSNYSFTKGTIVEYRFNNNNYILSYSYSVKGEVFKATEVTDYFKCENGEPGCKGQIFKVKYSSKNPKNSTILLGKFENKKLKPSSF